VSTLPRIGVMLPTFDPFNLDTFPVVEAARVAERLGFDSVWAGDHLSYHAPVVDCLVSLACAASVTRHVRLGTAILLGALRPAPLVATATAALDRLSEGRFVLGLGAGGENPAEYAAVDVDPRERGARLEDLVRVLPQLWDGTATRFQGRKLDLDVPPLRPGPVQQPHPPIWLGGRSAAARGRAARLAQGWMPVWMSATRLSHEIAELDREAAEAGRACPDVALMMFAALGSDEASCRSDAARLAHGQYGLGLDRLERWLVLGAGARLLDEVGAAGAAGADEVILHATRPDWQGQFEAFAAALGLEPRPE